MSAFGYFAGARRSARLVTRTIPNRHGKAKGDRRNPGERDRRRRPVKRKLAHAILIKIVDNLIDKISTTGGPLQNCKSGGRVSRLCEPKTFRTRRVRKGYYPYLLWIYYWREGPVSCNAGFILASWLTSQWSVLALSPLRPAALHVSRACCVPAPFLLFVHTGRWLDLCAGDVRGSGMLQLSGGGFRKSQPAELPTRSDSIREPKTMMRSDNSFISWESGLPTRPPPGRAVGVERRRQPGRMSDGAAGL